MLRMDTTLDRNEASSALSPALSPAIAPAISPALSTVLSPTLLRRFDTPGPRYTSYPTADRFVEIESAQAVAALIERAERAERAQHAEQPKPLSLYLHIPFCESVCYYCACNKVITKHHDRASEYLDALEAEIDLVAAALGSARAVSQVHFGGGSPTFLADAEIGRVMQTLRRVFAVVGDAEMSIEVDPRTVTPLRLAYLRGIGFNRISFGVQDFDPAVQQAVHRVQPFASVQHLMKSARDLGFVSINADLIYGLPRQTPESFARTVEQIGALRPDRIALYAYAHLPQRFKPQRRIDAAELPSAEQRVAMLGQAIAGFLAGGYDYIGMDHFALQDDALAQAKRGGQLHRNFQGYSTQADCDLVGLGVSAISSIGAHYYQNAKTLPAYYGALQGGVLPTERGIALDADDLLRRRVIMALMCQGRLDFAAIESAHDIQVAHYFAAELLRLQPLVEAGLVHIEPDAIQVTAAGWYLVRAVAMVFDRHLHREPKPERFSRIV
jgi:oxygen-independent coproporphyrinogen III oxidase